MDIREALVYSGNTRAFVALDERDECIGIVPGLEACTIAPLGKFTCGSFMTG